MSLLEKELQANSTRNQGWHFLQGQKDWSNHQTKINKLKKRLKIHVNNIRMDPNANKFANLIINTEAQSSH